MRTAAQTIAANLRRRRIELGLSQSEVALKATISQKYLSKLELSRRDGAVCPSAAVFLRLCEALNSSPDELSSSSTSKTTKNNRARVGRNSVRRELSRLVLTLAPRHALVVKQLVETLVDLERRKGKPVGDGARQSAS